MGVPSVQNPKPAEADSKQKKPRQASTKEKQDDMIMNTNNSCIVSKRSVEKIYHKDDAGFLRYFVSKFQRRSPLINRGYWLRMQAVEHVVRQFLRTDTAKPKAVANLGCGYDTLPFKFLAKERELCGNAKFMDVDYAQLIEKKCKVVRATRELSKHVEDALELPDGSSCVRMDGAHYAAVACDLQNRKDLEKFAEAVRLSEHTILFLAEVSMTYMDADAATSLIEWASNFENARFCLLEQFLPDGQESAFARTMLGHFRKLQSPLKSAIRFPTLQDQQQRFTEHGWREARAASLWALWCNDAVISSEDRRNVDRIEPFDEWEEFTLFGCHYFILVASTGGDNVELVPGLLSADPDGRDDAFRDERTIPASIVKQQKGLGQRRHGASFLAGARAVVNHGGHGPKGRLSSADVFSADNKPAVDESIVCIPGAELMCHSITKLKDGAYLLVGGRRSPDRSERGCFCWTIEQGWHGVEDLPAGRYRHSAVAAGSGALVMGGKVDSANFATDWLFWEVGRGWRTVKRQGESIPSDRFGACATTVRDGTRLRTGAPVEAVLSGGMDASGRIVSDVWGLGGVRETNDGGLEVDCHWIETEQRQGLEGVGRFGARLVEAWGGLYALGGCGAGAAGRGVEVVHIDPSTFCIRPLALQLEQQQQQQQAERRGQPMLVGHSAEVLPDGRSVLVVGGGGVCFSMGSVWNEDAYIVRLDGEEKQPRSGWALAAQGAAGGAIGATPSCRHSPPAEPHIAISRVDLGGSPERLRRILDSRRPAILEKLDIGECVRRWSLEYLEQAVGAERRVTVHASSSAAMSFVDRNFAYRQKGFGEFLRDAAGGAREYMRATSSTEPQSRATSLEDDFPGLAADFRLPAELARIAEQQHSSVLRIAGPVRMWLHYDVMANVLCQVRGAKRLLLYAPGDVDKLELAPGASSSRLDPLDEGARAGSALGRAQGYEAMLGEGDVLFIPALWAHAAAPTEGVSVAVNVFFRDLPAGYAAGRDVYGNRDLAAYERGRQDVQRVVRAFRDLPGDAARFYLQRLADELATAARQVGSTSG